ncbi:hypothetical protein KIPB_011817, partial [Kipferlia bialata]
TINMSDYSVRLPPPCQTVEELRLLIEEHKAVSLDVEKFLRDCQSLRSDDLEAIRKLSIHYHTLVVRKVTLETRIGYDYMRFEGEKEKRVERRREADKRRAKVYMAREERLFKTAHLPNFPLGSAVAATTGGRVLVLPRAVCGSSGTHPLKAIKCHKYGVLHCDSIDRLLYWVFELGRV